jgi:hypothetical protein
MRVYGGIIVEGVRMIDCQDFKWGGVRDERKY